jgi:hypothetical protein
MTSSDSPKSSGKTTSRVLEPTQFGQRRKGIFAGEALRAICRQVGVSEKELREIGAKAIRHNNDLAKTLLEQIAARPLSAKERVIDAARSRLTPVFASTYGMPLTGSVSILSAQPNKFFRVEARGLGDAPLLTEIENTEGVQFSWKTPAQAPGTYFFEIPMIACGPWFLIADDGPCEDKHATLWCRVECALETERGGQVYFYSNFVSADVFPLTRVENGTQSNDIVFIQNMQFQVPEGLIQTGDLLNVSMMVQAIANASGGGSFAVLDMTQNVGEVWAYQVNIGWISL